MLNSGKWTFCLSLAGGLILAGAAAAGAQSGPETAGAGSGISIVGDCVRLPGQDTIVADDLRQFLKSYEEIARTQSANPSNLDTVLASYGFDRAKFSLLKTKIQRIVNLAYRLDEGDPTISEADRRGITECEINLIRANMALIELELAKNFSS